MVLFPSYLFFSGGDNERITTLRTNRVVQVIRVVDQERLRNELQNVRLACSGERPVALYPGLKVGQRCRVISGSLRGLEGVVLRRRSICRVYLGVDVLGQSAQLEIDPSLLEVME
jgi:transcription antitermination factor NusG